MKKLMFTLAAASLAGLVQADWIPTAGGTYNYNDSKNWDDGTPNGVFSSTLTGNQTILFRENTTLADGLTLTYGGKFSLTFEADAAEPVTVTLGGDITMNTVVNESISVTLGSTTDGKGFTLDLGGNTRTLSVAQSKTTLKILNKITNGGLILNNTGTLNFNDPSNDYELGTTIKGTGSLSVMQNTFGTGTITIENASFAPTASCTFTNDNPIILKGRVYLNGNGGNFNLGAGPLTIEQPINVDVSKNTLTLGGQVAEESPCGIDAITKGGGGTLTTKADCVVERDVTFTATQGNWNLDGKIVTTGKVAFAGGGQDGTSYIYVNSTENAFSGEVTIAGDVNFAMVQFSKAGTLPEGVTFKILDKGVLMSSGAYSCAVYLAGGRISTDSTGSLCVGVANETGDLDLSAYPTLGFGAATNLGFAGTVQPNGGVYRFAGPAILTLAGENAVTGARDVEISGGGEVRFSNVNDLSGTVTVEPGSKVRVMDANGSFPNATFVINRGTLNLSSGAACDILRVKDVRLNAGMIWFAGNKSAHVCHRIGTLTLDGCAGVGGTPQITFSGDNGPGVHLRIGELKRPNFCLCQISGDNLGLNALDAAGFNITVDTGVETLGSGAVESTGTPVVPWARRDAGFLTYDAEKGFRQIDSTNERLTYTAATTIDGSTITGANVFFSAADGGTLAITGENPELTSFAFGYQGKSMFLTSPDGTIKVTGAALSIDGNGRPYFDAAVDFGANRGYILERQGKGQSFRGKIAGTGGLTIGSWSTGNSTGSNGTGLECGFKDSTFTGDVHLFSRVDSVLDGCFPSGERSGNTYVHGLWMCGSDSITLNGLYGAGIIRLGNSYTTTFSLGSDGSDGDFPGSFLRSNGTLSLKKIGAGRQRFAGESTHNGATTVEAGVFQNDGAFTASAVTVKTGATLAGSGSFAKLVTLEDGAKLEAGSLKTEDLVMDLEGGLTLQGAAALDLVAKDRSTVAGVAVAGDLTIPADKVVTVNVLLAKDAQGKDVKLKGPAEHVVFTAESALVLKNFKRGTNCGPLKLSADGTQVLMSVQDGFAISVR